MTKNSLQATINGTHSSTGSYMGYTVKVGDSSLGCDFTPLGPWYPSTPFRPYNPWYPSQPAIPFPPLLPAPVYIENQQTKQAVEELKKMVGELQQQMKQAQPSNKEKAALELLMGVDPDNQEEFSRVLKAVRVLLDRE